MRQSWPKKALKPVGSSRKAMWFRRSSERSRTLADQRQELFPAEGTHLHGQLSFISFAQAGRHPAFRTRKSFGNRDAERGLAEIPELIGDRDSDREVSGMGVVVRHGAQRSLRADGELALQVIAPRHGHGPRR